MASPYRRYVSLLSGPQDLPGSACSASGLSQRRWAPWCLCLNFFPDAHKSDEHLCFCGDSCRVGGGKRKWELSLCGSICLRCIYRLNPMVAYPKRWCRRVSGKVQPSWVAVGEQDFRRNHHGVWFACAPESESMRAQLHIVVACLRSVPLKAGLTRISLCGASQTRRSTGLAFLFFGHWRGDLYRWVVNQLLF